MLRGLEENEVECTAGDVGTTATTITTATASATVLVPTAIVTAEATTTALLLLLLLLLVLLLLLLLLLLFCPAHYSQSISKRADAIMIGMKSQQGKPKRTLPKEKTIKNKTELIRVAFER